MHMVRIHGVAIAKLHLVLLPGKAALDLHSLDTSGIGSYHVPWAIGKDLI